MVCPSEADGCNVVSCQNPKAHSRAVMCCFAQDTSNYTLFPTRATSHHTISRVHMKSFTQKYSAYGNAARKHAQIQMRAETEIRKGHLPIGSPCAFVFAHLLRTSEEVYTPPPVNLAIQDKASQSPFTQYPLPSRPCPYHDRAPETPC